MRAVTCTQDSVTASLALVEGSVISVRRTSGVIRVSNVFPAIVTRRVSTQTTPSATRPLGNAPAWKVCSALFELRELVKPSEFQEVKTC